TILLVQMCVLIFIGANGKTYYNTATLVSCVQNFPKHRGPIVGILKGFAGLSGAILTQIYTMINTPDDAVLIFMIAVGPAMVVIALMFFVRPVGGRRQVQTSDTSSFTFVYNGSQLQEPLKQETDEKPISTPDVIFSEFEDEKPREVDLLPASERKKKIVELQARLLNAVAEGAIRMKRRKEPHRGEDFTLMQALIKADFWLIFFSLLLGSGSGLTVIDNLGQLSQSLGYKNTDIFVSMISIWNFLGRVGGGYISEVLV
ncbi:hypothetical protein AMTR_s01570p00000230, partial [Amborella trichopoda]